MNNDNRLEMLEWIESIQSVILKKGIKRAKFLLNKIYNVYKKKRIILFQKKIKTDYVNSISKEKERPYPGDLRIEKKICSAVRWNAIVMVLRASRKNLDLGGHLSSFQSSANIYEVCFNHFFKGKSKFFNGDLVYFQGHISPGIYSRSFLEGRLSVEQLNNFRQEVNGKGLSSYPHPKLMPNFWQFPTVSMGLGAVCAIYQAKFLKYLNNRNLKNTKEQVVYAFLGDGEMDEPESKGALAIAAREKLDNLIFIINCNLQRLDGPVIGNGKIINELENCFSGSGWEVIKVVWGSKWDKLFKKDKTRKLIQLVNETVDGDYQTMGSKDGRYIRNNFFGKYLETEELVKNMSDEEILGLNRGGHDPKKIYSAVYEAIKVKDKPVVILVHTVKGYGMGNIAEGKNIAHQVKNIDLNSLKYIRDRLNIDIKDKDLKDLPYVSFKHDSLEYQYMTNRRKELGGYIPKRQSKFSHFVEIPPLDVFSFLLEKSTRPISTTVAFVRMLNILLQQKKLKDRIVPIIADEARTFGMEGLFSKIGIYNSLGQKYVPQDKGQLLYYKEDKKGQIIQEGINELGAAASWLSAATSYSTNDFPMIPFYIYYSIFGFQRIGDLLWAAGDQQARGFLIGATAGRTTLNGEGLQHEDGHSHVQSLTIPNCISYNPAFSYEIAVIIQNGIYRMYGPNQENIFYYITTFNENYFMPKISNDVQKGICKGIYKLESLIGKRCIVQLLGSGSILQCVRIAAKILKEKYDIGSDVYSVTSFTELAREGQDCDRWNLLHPLSKKKKVPYVTQIIERFPTIACTDYMKIYAEQIRKYIPSKRYYVLGTDGFGRSDSRQKLRDHFEVSENYIVLATLQELYFSRAIERQIFVDAMKEFNIDAEKVNPRLA